ncbi:MULTISPECIES: nuclear transport factor 2 family protein [unclassified Micromonospora]|uniref:nuclear transport factor 2 family protein n=1 Tax=Micromonospora TaxID=1873 RepID=UPI0022B685E7|nr:MULTISPECIES: nuclear transport factor 2 family protein [unclassified Micromonospora]MCZ7421225.1 nuclear transport factor 2 family protein [Verrucosispora sp. WMMA2121]WBB94075.1 nuclear transport factor 2 family protein [Verrucosispora sp. WMMC514]
MTTITQDLEKELFALEQEGWRAISSANGDFYRQLVTAQTLVVEHDGISTGDDLVAEIDGNTSPFTGFTLDEQRIVPVSDDTAVITYRAIAEVSGRGTFRLYMSSLWQRQADGWKLLFHQQTPMSNQES